MGKTGVILFLFISISSTSQRLRVTDCFAPAYEVDTSTWVNKTVESIEDVDGINNEIDPEQLDVRLLNRALFGTINKARSIRHRKRLKPDSLLNQFSYYYAVHKGTYLFRKPSSARRSMNRDMRKLSEMIIFEQGIIKGIFITQDLLNYNNSKPFMLYRENDPDGELVYGRYRDTRDSGYVPEYIPRHTYTTICEEILKKLNRGKYRRLIMSKYQTHLSVYVKVDERTIGKKMIPVLKIAIILGAPRVIVDN